MRQRTLSLVMIVASGLIGSGALVGCVSEAGGELRPVAKIGGDGVGTLGEAIALDGSQSSVPGKPAASLSYHWSVVVSPSGSSTSFDPADSVQTGLLADTPGLYVVRLVVRYAGQESAPDYADARVIEAELPPAANAGPDQSVDPGALVQLDGSASRDPNGGALLYQWTQSSGPNVALSDPSAAAPTFVSPRPAGSLAFSLIVTDPASLDSVPDDVVVNVLDLPPVAVIVAPGRGDEGAAVALDGVQSYDPNGDPGSSMSFSWAVSSTLGLSLLDAAAPRTSFTIPSFCGIATAEVSLIVHSSGADSAAAVATVDLVDILPDAPTADAGIDQAVDEGGLAQLDGSGSSDCAGETIRYAWQQTSGPSVVLSDSAVPNPSFTAPPAAGAVTVVFLLTVTDPGMLTDSASVSVLVRDTINDPPVAQAGPPQTVQVQQQVTLAGSGSDPNGDSISYAWTQSSGAVSVTLSSASSASPTFTAPSVPGPLSFSLVVSDGSLSSSASTVLIDVTPAGPDLGASTLNAAASSLTADGSSSTLVTAHVTDGLANPLSGLVVVIQSSAGSLLGGSPADQGNGDYTQTLQAPVSVGVATLSFTIGGSAASATTSVSFLPGDSSGTIVLSPSPLSIVADGSSSSTLSSAPIRDANNNIVADGSLVTVSSDQGSLLATDMDNLLNGTQVATTVGVISFSLQSSTTATTATVSANSVVGAAWGQAQVPFVTGPPAGTINLVVASPSLVADGISSTQFTGGLVTDLNGNTVPDGTLVTLEISLAGVPGSFVGVVDQDLVTPGIQVATSGGSFVVTVKAGTVAGTLTLTAKSVLGTATGSANLLLLAGPAVGMITLGATPDPIVVTGSASPLADTTTVTSGTITDVNGNPVTDGKFVTVSATLGGVMQGVDASPAGGFQVVVSGGVVVFDVKSSHSSGTLTVSATLDTASGSTSVSVSPGPATNLVKVSGDAQTGVVGQALAAPLRVRAEDVYGNRVPGVSLSFNVTAGGGSVLPASATTGSLGRASTVATLGTIAGIVNSFQATAPGLLGSPVAFQATATPGPIAALQVTGYPSPSVAGSTAPITITAKDSYGNVVTGFVGTVDLVSNDPQANLAATHTFTTGEAGVASVSLSLRSAGTYFVTATDQANPLIQGSQTGLVVQPGAADHLAMVTQASNVVSMVVMAPAVVVEVLDAYGNRVTLGSVNLTASFGTDPSVGATLGGTLIQPSGSGLASFSGLTVDLVGTGYTLAFGAPGLTGVSSASFNVTPGAPAKLAFRVQPSGAMATTLMSPAVEVEVQDAGGNFLSSTTDPITLSIGSDPNGVGVSTLSGTLTVSALAGVASFGDLSLSPEGVGFSLQAAAPGLGAALSAPFTISLCMPLAAPVAGNLNGATTVFPWDTINLDGSGSRDCGGSYNWSVGVTASTATVGLVGGFAPFAPQPRPLTGSGVSTTYYVEEPGTYTYSLVVDDGLNPSTVTTQIVVVGFSQINYGSGVTAVKDTRAIAVAPMTGNLVLGTEVGAQAYSLSNSTVDGMTCISGTQGRAIAVLPTGDVVLGHGNSRTIDLFNTPQCVLGAGLSALDPATASNASGGNPGKVRAFLVDGGAGNFLAATDKDLFYYDDATTSFTEYSFATPGADAEYRGLGKDHDGDYWLGSWENSPADLCVKTPTLSNQTVTLDLVVGANDRSQKMVRGLSQALPLLDEMWIATQKGVVYVTDAGSAANGGTALYDNTNSGDLLDDDARAGVLEDRTTDLWFVTKTGIARYKRDVDAFATIALGTFGLPASGGGSDLFDVAMDQEPGRARTLFVAAGVSGVYLLIVP